MALISVTDLTKTYHVGEVAIPALRGVSLDIEVGEFVAIMGASGSGKSTLLHILGFLDHPSTGQYVFDGQTMVDYSEFKLAKLRNQKIGFVFQAFNLLPRTTVLENVLLPLQYSDRPVSQHKKIATEALEEVGLIHRLNHTTAQLSGGEKQRVAIARALVNNPLVIFADEPTGNLDSVTGEAVMEIIDNLHGKGRTVILITHETPTAHYAERIITIKDGTVLNDIKQTQREPHIHYSK